MRALAGVEPSELVSLVEAGDAEPRRRVARALAARDAYLELAIGLLGGPLDDVGSLALQGQIARWTSTPLAAPKSGETLERDVKALVSRESDDVFLIDRGAGVAASFRRLSRRADVPLATALDPRLAGNPRLVRPLAGGWFALSSALAHAYPSADLVGYGVEPFAARKDRRGWLALVPRNLAQRTASEVLVDWCIAAASDNPRDKTAGLRALVASGWPAALDWTESLVRAGDPIARGVLLDAAARGAVAPILTGAQAVRRTLDEFDALIATNEARAERRVYALMRQPARAPNGDSLVDTLLSGWDELGSRGRRARWQVLARWGSFGPDAARISELAQAELQRADLDAPLALAVIEALAARGPQAARAAIELTPQAARLLLLESTPRRTLLLADARVDPPAALTPSDEHAPQFVAWLAGRGKARRAAELASALLTAQPTTDLFPVLEPWRRAGEAGMLRSLLGQLAASVGSAHERAATRLRFLLGQLDPAAAGQFARSLTLPEPGDGLAGADLPVLARLVSAPQTRLARKAVEALQAELLFRAAQPKATEAPAELLAAFDQIIESFTATGRDVELDPLLTTLDQLLRGAPARWVRSLAGRWPLPPRAVPILLGESGR